MIGAIVAWSGAIVDIPAGWQLCDGTNGTPNLQDKFIVGAGDTYLVGDEGGSVGHDHSFEGSGHDHFTLDSIDVPDGGDASAWSGDENSTETKASGTTDESDNLPPYYALAWIMRLS